MDEQTARDIANKIVHDTSFYIAVIGLIGALLGSVLTIVGNSFNQYYGRRADAKRDEPRRRVLRQLLEDDRFADHWRRLDTLMHVIGSDEATTTRLLIEVGARGSEDGQRLWGLMKYHPFPQTP